MTMNKHKEYRAFGSDQRMTRKIARAKASHMSNAKWRKLFVALHELPGRPLAIGIKLIGHTVMSTPIPGPDFEFDDNFGEFGGLTSVPFVHIEYVGISNSEHTNAVLIAHLSAYGNWPFWEEEEGVLIVGYEWE